MTGEAIPATAAPEGDFLSDQPLSKSQKKRMKQKAAKARRDAAEAEARERELAAAEEAAIAAKVGGLAGSSAARQTGNLNPHDRLRLSVMSMGYSADEVTAAMEEMWELQLRYDEVEAVVSYLESKAVQGEADTKIASATADSATDSTAESSGFVAVVTPSAAAAVVDADVPTIEEGTEEKEGEEEPPMSSAPSAVPVSGANSSKSKSSRSGKKTKPQPVGLVGKLEMVSNFENLNDAVFALTEWATKVAKQHEILDFCDSNKCRALSTVLRRAILEGVDSLGSIMDMIGAVLRASGASASAVTPAAKSLGSAIVQARSVASTDVASARGVAQTVASSVAEAVVASLRLTADKLKTASQDSERVIRRVEQEVDALVSSLPAGGVGATLGVVDLMTRRDCHKVAAEKYGSVADIVILSASVNDSSDAEGTNGELDGIASEEKKEALLASLLGNEYESIISNRTEHSALEARLDEAQTSSRTEREELKTKRDIIDERKKVIAARMEELRIEMAQLDGEDKELGEKLKDVENKLDFLDKDCDDTVLQMKTELKEKEEILRLDNGVCGVTEKLQAFEGALSKLCMMAVSKNDSGKSVMTSDKLSNKMGIYFVRMRNYFKAEADCVELIDTRVNSLSKEAEDLEREIAECEALGMATNVAQMTLQLKRIKRNVDDDNVVVLALRKDAEKMRDDFMRHLKEYNAAFACSGVESNKAFSSLQLSVLTGIKDAMSRIGVDDGGLNSYLDSFVGEVVAPLALENGAIQSPSEKSLPDSADDESGSAKGIPGTVLPLQISSIDNIPVAVAPSPAKAVAPPPSPARAPKLSWAVATGPKKPALSLREIQQQELSAKKEETEFGVDENKDES